MEMGIKVGGSPCSSIEPKIPFDWRNPASSQSKNRHHPTSEKKTRIYEHQVISKMYYRSHTWVIVNLSSEIPDAGWKCGEKFSERNGVRIGMRFLSRGGLRGCGCT